MGNSTSLNKSIDAIKHRVLDAKVFQKNKNPSIQQNSSRAKRGKTHTHDASKPKKAFRK